MLITKKLLDVLLVTSTLNIVLEWCNYEQNKLAFDAFFTLHLYLCFQCSVTNRISFKHLKKNSGYWLFLWCKDCHLNPWASILLLNNLFWLNIMICYVEQCVFDIFRTQCFFSYRTATYKIKLIDWPEVNQMFCSRKIVILQRRIIPPVLIRVMEAENLGRIRINIGIQVIQESVKSESVWWWWFFP